MTSITQSTKLVFIPYIVRMPVYLKIIVLLLGLSTSALCQNADTLLLPKTGSYISLQYDNDFFSATDRYYTQGIVLSFVHGVVHYSPFTYALIRLNKNAQNYYGLHLEQDVFTPKSIRYREGAIYYGERPFTAVFFMSHSLASISSQKKHLLRTRLDLGVIGPAAKGEEEQKGIHKALDNIEPQGWQNQLANDVVINYNLQCEKGLVNFRYFEGIVSGSLRLGTLYADAGIGGQLRAGLLNPYFHSPAKRKHKFRIYGHAKINARLVGYNATLQGGLFSSSIYTLPAASVSRFVLDALGGIVVTYKRLSLEYSKAYITPEFKKGVDHGWGRCVITCGF
jgi:lipid A 3-O-deacylase